MKKKNILLLLLFLIIFALLFVNQNTNNTSKKNDIKITKKIEKKENYIELLKKKYNNDDVIGSIEIAGAKINEVVLQHTDNDYYLKHDAYGNNDIHGSVFLDHRCDINSRKLLIFNHSSTKGNTPFSNLEKYYDKKYYIENPYINLLIGNEKRKYHIFSVYVETEDFTYMNLKINDQQYNQDLKKYKSKSLYDTGVNVKENDNILILQTCSNHVNYKKYKNKYLLIIARRVSL